MLRWNVAVYCANEAGRLTGCLRSVLKALSGRNALVTVILNGSRDGSLDIARQFLKSGAPLEIFQIKIPDKANAINKFHHLLRSPAHFYGNVDGYVFVGNRAFASM